MPVSHRASKRATELETTMGSGLHPSLGLAPLVQALEVRAGKRSPTSHSSVRMRRRTDLF